MYRPLRTLRFGGFTLIELMITIVVASILLSIAIPSYQQQTRKSRRTEARTAVLDLATREERYFSTSNTYSASAATLGYPGWGAANPIGSGYYYLNVAVTAADPTQTPPVPAGYSITATATGTQVNDTSCASFTVDQTGKQSSLNSGGADSTSTCWN
ncbi:MAG TPA: type IV pilin protein [Steroidobacteraceae bacterium]|nr:type IV pilin protein [Steroidobacteraceae bacterium]